MSSSRQVGKLTFVHHPACSKPEPIAYCKCGENAGCRTCGWGKGSLLCSCRRASNSESK